MQATVDLPQAFSVRDENEFYPIRHLISSLNPKFMVTRVATGVHVNGGSTVLWGLVHAEGQSLTKKEVEAALRQAGFDLTHNVLVQASNVWSGDPDEPEKT